MTTLLLSRKKLSALAVCVFLLLGLFVSTQNILRTDLRPFQQDIRLALPEHIALQVHHLHAVPILLESGDANVRSVDVVLKFDHTMLAVEDIALDATATTTFKTFTPLDPQGSFAVQEVIAQANQTGQLEFGALAFDWPSRAATTAFHGTTVLATLQLRALQPGSSTLSFEFQPGSTTDSNIVLDTRPPHDALAAVANLTITAKNVTSGTTDVH